MTTTSFPCTGCGARLEHSPGTDVLECPYCGSEQAIVPLPRQVTEHRFSELAARDRAGVVVFSCPKCAARTESDAVSERCPFCATQLVADEQATGQLSPEAVLPFIVTRNVVRDALRVWVSTRWFAPSSLKNVSSAESVKSLYLPHWTLDAQTHSDYTGQRGDHYWVTETYTTTNNGQTQTHTRQVRHTRWRPASGSVSRHFDDLLVCASARVPEKHMERLSTWPLEQAEPYQPAYLAGHQTLRYEIEPEAALDRAKHRMAEVIEGDCKEDIGGDQQRVSSVDTRYSDLTYKLMLLPIWIVCYVHAGRSWQVYINGANGEITGDRPYSAVKVTAAVVLGILVTIAAVFLLTRK